MESRDIVYHSSSTKTYNTQVSQTSNLSTGALVNTNGQLLPQFDPFKPAEYVLNNLRPAPGEEKLYSKILKKAVQNIQNTSLDKQNMDIPQSTSVYTKENAQQQSFMEIDDTNSSVDDVTIIESQVDDASIIETQIDNGFSSIMTESSAGNSKLVEEESIIIISDEENEKTKDGGELTVDKDKLLRLYSHKLHVRKPRMSHPRISFDDSGILSDSDEFA